MLNPEYSTTFSGFSLKLGARIFASLDSENDATHFLVYPDLKLQKSIIEEQLNIYAGVFGDFHTNTYQSFTEENPFVSPTLFITQTAEKYNVFVGLNGVINNDFSFNISANLKEEEDKALFVRNNSKSNGVSNFNNGVALKGFEYGNSFTLIYDDVKTTSIFAELEYDFTQKITFSTNFQFDNFTTQTQSEAWNLPTIQAAIVGKYKSNKWYATTNVFYVGERKDVLYSATSPSNLSGLQTLDAFVDVNLNGGYHFNDKFSAFLRFNNILNTSYQRFANFNVQGFQALGGITYKFDF
jgi:outer membrane cobalamin receptor